MSEKESDTSMGRDTEISAALGSLEIDVKTEGREECEQLFYNVWDYVNEDAAEMSEAVRDRLGGG